MKTIDTIRGWNSQGRFIKRGSKMCGRTESGVPLFAAQDTYAPGKRSEDWDGDPGYSDLSIGDFQ